MKNLKKLSRNELQTVKGGGEAELEQEAGFGEINSHCGSGVSGSVANAAACWNFCDCALNRPNCIR